MKNKDYMKILKLIPVLCLVVFSACKDPMDRYYKDDKFKLGGEPLLEELKKNPQYSTFTLLLEETGFLKEFTDANVVLTIWVPLDDYMPAEVLTLTKEEKVRMIRNHISLTSINSEALKAQKQVASLSGRFMPTGYNNGIYTVDGAELLNMDIICSNGMIQEISEWFLPRVTLFEYISNLGGDYTVFRDSLLGRNVESFDKDSSLAENVGPDGKPVWVPIYKTTNNILDYADLNDITKTFTVFIPTNEAIAGMYRDMSNYLQEANYEITSEDSARWMDWLMRTCIIDGQKKYEPDMVYENGIWKRSDSDEEKKKWEASAMYSFRTKFQEVYDPEPDKYLNGWSYNLNRIRVPKTMYVVKTEFNPYTIRKNTEETEGGNMSANPQGLDWWVGHVQANASGSRTDPEGVLIQFGRAGMIEDATETAYYSYKSAAMVTEEDELTGESTTSLQGIPVMPGYYDVVVRFGNPSLDGLANQTDSVQVSINGSTFNVKNITKGTYNRDDLFAITDLYVPGQYEPATVEIRLFDATEPDNVKYRAWRRIRVGITKLVPTSADSNYM